MTVTYSLDVANTRFCGFTKLLCRWKGSIYKILWKELLCFACGYTLLSVVYRCVLNDKQKRYFEDVVLYCETFIDLIPLSFVLGFYVSLVIGRWWNQFDAIPWPDRTCLLIGTVVHGADERSRTIRRTLGRYLILLQMFTFQSVSTAFKKRFPTVGHFEEAGLMTKEERTIYEQVDIPYGKWWLPAHWFCALAMRARKEGRIKDSVLLKTLVKEMLNYRSACGTMFNYDWISVPLVYTQVVTLATYTYSLALLMGRQYLDADRGFKKHEVDLYVPIFTLLQFFFYVGWLKVAEQIVNPYGEDDDDFELNWCLDRNAQIVYMLVDHLHTKHPKLRRDLYWDQLEPQIPHTKFTVKNLTNPQLGSAINLEIDPAKSDFLPMETLLEEDNEANVYDSVKHSSGIRYRPSILMNLINAGFRSSLRRKSTRKGDSFREASGFQGHVNPSFVMDGLPKRKGSTPSNSRRSSLNTRRTSSPTHSRASSVSFRKGSSINRARHKVYDVQQAESASLPQSYTMVPDIEPNSIAAAICATRAATASVVANFEEAEKPPENHFLHDQLPSEKDLSSSVPRSADATTPYMEPIPEEPSRPPSMPSLDIEAQPTANGTSSVPEEVQDLVLEASKVLEELNRVVKEQGHRKDCVLVGYESCCSLSSDESSKEDEPNLDTDPEIGGEDIAVVIEDQTICSGDPNRTSSFTAPERL